MTYFSWSNSKLKQKYLTARFNKSGQSTKKSPPPEVDKVNHVIDKTPSTCNRIKSYSRADRPYPRSQTVNCPTSDKPKFVAGTSWSSSKTKGLGVSTLVGLGNDLTAPQPPPQSQIKIRQLFGGCFKLFQARTEFV